MSFLSKFFARIVLNGAALYIATNYFPSFTLVVGITTLVIGALLLAILYTFLRPILTLVASPFMWLTAGLFTIVINLVLLWVADYLLLQLTISDLSTLFWVSIIVTLANSFF